MALDLKALRRQGEINILREEYDRSLGDIKALCEKGLHQYLTINELAKLKSNIFDLYSNLEVIYLEFKQIEEETENE